MIQESVIQASIKNYLDTIESQSIAGTLSTEGAKNKFSNELAKVIANAIKSATITLPAGTPISTSSGPGTITAPVECTIR